MQAAVVKIRMDRKTGKKISEEIIGYEEVDETEFYKPLVNLYYEKIFKASDDNTAKMLENGGM